MSSKEKGSLIIESMISIFGVVFSIWLLPLIFFIGTGQKSVNNILVIVMVLIAIIMMTSLITILRHMLRNQTGKYKGKITTSFGRIFIFIVICLVCYFLISLLCGVVSVLIYNLLKTRLSLIQIKAIINIITAGIVLLVMPLFISEFWSVVKNEKKLIKSIIAGFNILRKCYGKLTALLILLYGVGTLITFVLSLLSNNTLVLVIRGILMSCLGIVALRVTERICR